jgi:hypothetical protein
VRLATKIYQRVDFRWMLNDDPVLLSHGWRPETGFLHPRWDTYSEDTILYLLAIGSPSSPISARSWSALWKDRYRYAVTRTSQRLAYRCSCTSTHTRGSIIVDVVRQRAIASTTSKTQSNATLAHRQFCIDLSHTFPGYSPDVWGITASDSVKGLPRLGWPTSGSRDRRNSCAISGGRLLDVHP